MSESKKHELLKPCPLCSAPPEEVNFWGWGAMCGDCGVSFDMPNHTPKSDEDRKRIFIAQWNNRS